MLLERYRYRLFEPWRRHCAMARWRQDCRSVRYSRWLVRMPARWVRLWERGLLRA